MAEAKTDNGKVALITGITGQVRIFKQFPMDVAERGHV